MNEKLTQWVVIIGVILVACGGFFLFGDTFVSWLRPSQTVSVASQDDRQVQMTTVLSRDAIPAIDNPRFVSAANASSDYLDSELVIGVEINGDARAYSVPMLSRHEIVNDVVGDVPIAVTW